MKRFLEMHGVALIFLAGLSLVGYASNRWDGLMTATGTGMVFYALGIASVCRKHHHCQMVLTLVSKKYTHFIGLHINA